MPKNIEDIIVPEKRKSIRDIPIPDGRKKKVSASKQNPSAPIQEIRQRTEFDDYRENQTELPKKRAFENPYAGMRAVSVGRGIKRGRKFCIALGAGALIVIFAIMNFFSGGTLSYVPRSLALSFDNESMVAHKSGEEGPLFSVVKLTLDKGANLTARGEEEVNRKASGTIIVYNDASTAPQRLVEKTRFEASDGKVYRIENAITIPGRRTVGGKTEPGSIEVVVYADESGVAYNQDLTDFTLPGLKGTDRYKTIYARSKTPMTGGFVGKMKIVSDEEKVSALENLRNILEDEVIESAREQVPTDFVLFPSLATITFEELPQVDAGEGSVTLTIRANLLGVMFKKSDFSKSLATKKTALSPSDQVVFDPLESLDVRFSGGIPSDLLKADKINLSLSGNASLVWNTDETALRSSLVGKNKSEVESILNNFPSIKEADVVLRPFWKSSFSDKESKITIKKLSY